MPDKKIIDCRHHSLTEESYEVITNDFIKIIHNECYPRRKRVSNKIYKEKVMQAFIDTLSMSYTKKYRKDENE